MSIENVDIIDKIGIDIATNSVALTIIDDTDWTNVNIHLGLIQEKVYRYLDYIESGEMVENSPKFSNRSIIIRIYLEHEIPDEGITLLSNLKEYLKESLNINFVGFLLDKIDEKNWISVL